MKQLKSRIMKKVRLNSFLSLIAFCSLTLFAYSRSELKVDYTKSDITCFGKSNGMIELAISGGKEPYAVEWNNGQKETVLSNLKKGVYAVKVTDANGISKEEQISIEMPAPLMFAYSSNNETPVDAFNGVMDVAISGGTPWVMNEEPNYFVRLDGVSAIEDPASLKDGIYELSVEDAGGCKLSVKVNLDFEVSMTRDVTFSEVHTALDETNNGLGKVKMIIFQPNLMNTTLLQNDFGMGSATMVSQ